jgi:hypothetical protein
VGCPLTAMSATSGCSSAVAGPAGARSRGTTSCCTGFVHGHEDCFRAGPPSPVAAEEGSLLSLSRPRMRTALGLPRGASRGGTGVPFNAPIENVGHERRSQGTMPVRLAGRMAGIVEALNESFQRL